MQAQFDAFDFSRMEALERNECVAALLHFFPLATSVEIRDAVGVSAEERVLGLLRTHQRAHHVDHHGVEQRALYAELVSLRRDLLPNESLDLSLVDLVKAQVGPHVARRRVVGHLLGVVAGEGGIVE